MPTLTETLLTNAAVAALLAAVVFGVTRVVRKPAVVHALWLLVLLKLVTPPVVSIPIPVAGNVFVATDEEPEPADIRAGSAAAELVERVAPEIARAPGNTTVPAIPVPDLRSESDPQTPANATPANAMAAEAPIARPAVASVERSLTAGAPAADRSARPFSTAAWLVPSLLSVWALGSILLAVTTFFRVRRFRGHLAAAEPAPPHVLAEVRRLAGRIGLRRCPEVRLLAGRISPMAGALGRGTLIVLPQGLIADMPRGQLSTLLLHELAHLRRGDHWIRRLEMAAMLVYWWHPALWLARRELHRAEEACCDAWVAWLFPQKIRDYGEALLATLDYLAGGPRVVPAASGGWAQAGAMRRRFEMILKTQPNRRMSWAAKLTVLTLAAAILPCTASITATEGETGPTVPANETLPADDPDPSAVEEASSASNEAVANETRVDGVVIDVDGEPIVDARVAALGYTGDKAHALEPIYLRTDKEGRFRANVPGRRFRLLVGAPSEEYDDAERIGVRDGYSFSVSSDVEDRSAGGVVRPIVTLRRSYDLRFDLRDAESDRPVPDAAILYKEDEAYWVSEYPYETATWSAYRVLEQGHPVFREKMRPTMHSAHVFVLADGYQPKRLKLHETLQRGKTLVKRVDLQPLPPVELTIVTPGGWPASDARFETVQPGRYRSLVNRGTPDGLGSLNTYHGKAAPALGRLVDIEQTADRRGVIRVPYPAFGQWAIYRIVHPTGYAELRVKDLPEPDVRGTPIQQTVELLRYTTIRGEFLPEVAANEHLEICRLQPNRMTVAAAHERIELDERRRFEFPQRLAGWHSIIHRIQYTDPVGRRLGEAIGCYGPYRVGPGETADLTLGGQGRPVTGRVVVPEGVEPPGGAEAAKWQFRIYVESSESPGRPRAPAGLTDEKALETWWDAYWESDEGRRYRHYKGRYRMTISDDEGRFRLPMLPPGKYLLRATALPQNLRRRTHLRVEFEVPEGNRTDPLDLGDLVLPVDE